MTSIPLLIALVASGAAGLIYQICWIRSATLIVGSTTYALGLVLAAFFGGLAVGSGLFGRLAVAQARPLRIYAWLELGIAALGILSLFAFSAADALLVAISRASGAGTVTMLAEWLLLAVILAPPAVLMGGTLPLFCRYFVTAHDRLVADVSWVYALNTLGAAAGCVLAGLYLIPAIGLRWTIAIAAALNVAAALIALGEGRTVPFRPPSPAGASRTRSGEASRATILTACLFFLTGAAAMANEVLWTRFAALLVASTVTTYTLTIASVLLGIVIGSVVVARIGSLVPAAFTFGVLQAVLALWVMAVMHLPPSVWEALGSRVWMYLLLFLPPSIVSGASLPLAVRIVTGDVALAPRSVGTLGAANMAGGIVGAVGAAYLLPVAGLELGVRLTTALSLLAAWVAWLALDREPRRQTIGLTLAVAAGIGWIAVSRFAPTRIPDDFLTRSGVLVDVREGAHSILAVSRSDSVTVLTSDNLWQGQDEKSHQIMAAHVPMLLHPAPRRVLVVGVGAGQTPARFTLYDSVERIDAVDIEPAVFDVIRDHFDSAWMDDPRVRLLADDGRTVVQRSADRYDVISIEVGQLLRPGTGAFYTREFYERARQRLNDGGILGQFVPLAFLTPDEFRSVVATFLEVFPESVLWYNRTEPLLIGTTGSRLALDPARLELLRMPGPVHDDLRFAVWGGEAQFQNQPEFFMAGFLAGGAALRRLAFGGEVFTDDRPRLDYRAGQVLPPAVSEDPIIELVAAHMDPIEAIAAPSVEESLVARAAAIRAEHIAAVIASARLRRAAAAAR